MTATRVDTAKGRYYDVAGARYPSVTHILSVVGKPALVNWAASVERDMVVQQATRLYGDAIDRALLPSLMPPSWFETTLTARLGAERAHQKELAAAGEIGSQVHALVDWYLHKCQLARPESTEAADRAFNHFIRWAESVHLEPQLIERTVYSREYEYAGTLDLLATINGVVTLVDFKSSRRIYPEMHLQVTAYRQALQEMGTPADAAMIVRLPKSAEDMTIEAVTAGPADQLFPVFLAVKQLWSYLNAAQGL